MEGPFELPNTQAELCAKNKCPFLQKGFCHLAGEIIKDPKNAKNVLALEMKQVPVTAECIFSPVIDQIGSGRIEEFIVNTADTPIEQFRANAYFSAVTLFWNYDRGALR